MAQESELVSPNIRFGVFELDLAAAELRRSGVKVRLQEQPFQILSLLLERSGEVVTREEIQQKLWPDGTFVDFEHSLNAAVKRLRETLGDSADTPRYVETVPRRGYRFIYPVEEPETPAPVPLPQRRPLWIGPLALGTLVLAVAVVWWPLTLRDKPAEPLEITPLTFDGGWKDNPRLSPDGEMVAFNWNGPDRANTDLYIKPIGPDTSVLRLTTHPAEDVGGVWSPDGKRLVFLQIIDNRATIYTIPSLGGQVKKIIDVEGPAYWLEELGLVPALSWSPDGRFLAYGEKPSEEEPARIVLLDMETLEKRGFTKPPEGKGVLGDLYPSFSPDGRQIAFARSPSAYANLDIWVKDLEGGQVRQITSGQWQFCHSLAWTPDGQELLFTAGDPLHNRVYRVRLDEGRPRLLTGLGERDIVASLAGNRLAFLKVSIEPPDIWQAPGRRAKDRSAPARRLISSSGFDGGSKASSPDGRQIAFASDRTGKMQIWIADQDGSNPRRLTDMKINGAIPHWSPDGQQIAFLSRDSGNTDSYVVEVDSGQVRQLTTHEGEDWSPTFSRDGRWIYFGSNRGGVTQIYKMPAQGGEAVQVTQGGGIHAHESQDGQFLYYSQQMFGTGIWRVPVDGGKEVEVVAGAFDFNNWDLAPGGIYYTTGNYQSDDFRIHYLDLASGKTSEIYREDGFFDRWQLAVSPDEEVVLFTKVRHRESEVVLVENYRGR